MKKVGIITFHEALNYGAQLQLFALYKMVQKNNYDVRVIDYHNKEISGPYRLLIPKTKSKKTFVKTLVRNIISFPSNLSRHLNFKKTINKEFSMISMSKLNELDMAICGSDQIWNPRIVKKIDEYYTLFDSKFDNMKRISYAASTGSSAFVDERPEEYKKYLSKIDHFSVREHDTEEKLRKLLNKDIATTLDPTLLLNSKEWEEFLPNSEGEECKYIFAYNVTFDEDYLKIVNSLSEKTGLKVIYGDWRNKNYINTYKSIYPLGPLEFVNYIKNAEYVVTTSFHATVFSILFHKNFFVVPHKVTGERVTNLLNICGIEGRNFNNSDDFNNVEESNIKTDWNKVDELLNEERKKSLDWLIKALED